MSKASCAVIKKERWCIVSISDAHHSPPGKHLSFYEGDIRLTKKQTENLKKYGDPTKGSADSRAASNVDSERWPNAVIPYTFDCSIGKFTNIVTSWWRRDETGLNPRFSSRSCYYKTSKKIKIYQKKYWRLKVSNMVRVRVVLKRTVVGDWRFENLQWAEVIFRVKWKVLVSRWCQVSGPLNWLISLAVMLLAVKTRVNQSMVQPRSQDLQGALGTRLSMVLNSDRSVVVSFDPSIVSQICASPVWSQSSFVCFVNVLNKSFVSCW